MLALTFVDIDFFVQWERKYGQLLDEKEIMAVEVVKLRDRLLQLETEQAETMEGENMGLSKYSPNNPYALQRKIGMST